MKRIAQKINRVLVEAVRALLPNRGRDVAVARVGVPVRPVRVSRRR